ncbi:MAG: 3-oxoacyl-ACP reductase FabG [Lentimicrobiaceae bacterium]|nr:3-oxoacyl-ACP reductase FabG [Lentimicrobiaceae bacterium]
MKHALVTGGSRGIGRAICIELSNLGYNVIINYKGNKAAAEETLNMIKNNGKSAELLQFDISNVDEVDSQLEKWFNNNEGSYISVLVNNAGIRNDSLMLWMQNEQWKNVIDTNLNGFFYVTRRLIKDMLVRKSGRIINIVSLSGIKGLPGQTNYSAAKAAVIGATKALAQEVGRKGVTVNAIAPGYIKSEMTEDLDEKELSKLVPVNRFGLPEEVAYLVGVLTNERAAYITGEVISVNGGIHT